MSLKSLIDDVTRETGYELKNGEVLYTCPKCHHHKKKLSVNVESHKWKCWVCSKTNGTEGASIRTLFKLFGANEKYLGKLSEYGYKTPFSSNTSHEGTDKPAIQLPNEFVPLHIHSKDIKYRHAIHYLKKRNVSLRDIVKYNIGYCSSGEFDNHIIFPSYDEHGCLNYFIGRTWNKESFMKYKKPPYSSHKIVGLEFLANWDYPVHICEGVFDAIAIRRNAIPLFGKIMGNSLKEKLILNKPPTYLIFDNDAVSDLLKTCEELVKYDVPLFPVLLDKKDPSEIGYKNIHKLINNTTQLSFSDLLKMKINS